MDSDNSLIRYLSNAMTFTIRSIMSSNICQILYDLNIDLQELELLSLKDIKEMYYNKWYTNVNNQYLIHSKVIYDLIMMKEGMYFSVFDNFQCDLIINFLSTL